MRGQMEDRVRIKGLIEERPDRGPCFWPLPRSSTLVLHSGERRAVTNTADGGTVGQTRRGDAAVEVTVVVVLLLQMCVMGQ